MKVQELRQLLFSLPQDADVYLSVCVSDRDTQRAVDSLALSDEIGAMLDVRELCFDKNDGPAGCVTLQGYWSDTASEARHKEPCALCGSTLGLTQDKTTRDAFARFANLLARARREDAEGRRLPSYINERIERDAAAAHRREDEAAQGVVGDEYSGQSVREITDELQAEWRRLCLLHPSESARREHLAEFAYRRWRYDPDDHTISGDVGDWMEDVAEAVGESTGN